MDIQEYIASGVIESYVLGVADAAEGAEVERLMKEYSEVKKAIDDFSAALEDYAIRNAVPPPVDLKASIMARLSSMDETTAETSPLSVAYNSNDSQMTTGSIVSMQGWKIAAAAAIILFVASAATNAWLYNKYTSTQQQYQALLQDRNTLQASNQVYQTKISEYQSATEMMANPAVVMVKMVDPNKKQNNMTTVFWNTISKEVYFMANKLPAHGKDKQYQLWALVDGKPVDAGMIDNQCTSLCKMKNIAKAQAFAITLEKAGGNPVPTLEQLFVLGNV